MRFPFLIISLLFATSGFAAQLIIPMDDVQKNHLKAYGIAYYAIERGMVTDWMLNYRGGSFSMNANPLLEKECKIRGISYEIIPDVQYAAILQDIADPEVNQDVVKLEKAPKIAVYSPKTKQPWDDAVTLALTYAEIPYTVVYDDEIMQGKLPEYDWLHLHHEDFTGQFGKFWSSYSTTDWYKKDVAEQTVTAQKWGFSKVSQLKGAVVKKMRDFVMGGGFLFAMCSAADTYDIALAADGVDICEYMFDGDPMDPNAQRKLDFSKTFAFQNFTLVRDPYYYEHSDIDVTNTRGNVSENSDFFTLFDFSAKWDPVPSMLCQNHLQVVHAYMGQSTAYKKSLVKPGVLVMGENKSLGEARYIHGEYGKGTWTFYGGHDPEDYQHMVYEPPTDLALFPNSAGYRLILNNILFPAAKKKKQKKPNLPAAV